MVFTLDEGFAIPVDSRKTTDVHARYVHPTSPVEGRGVDIYIPTRTFIVVVWTIYKMLRRFHRVANNVNKRLLLCTHFFTLLSSALRFNVGSGRSHLPCGGGYCFVCTSASMMKISFEALQITFFGLMSNYQLAYRSQLPNDKPLHVAARDLALQAALVSFVHLTMMFYLPLIVNCAHRRLCNVLHLSLLHLLYRHCYTFLSFLVMFCGAQNAFYCVTALLRC